jgi:hypothetical protein
MISLVRIEAKYNFTIGCQEGRSIGIRILTPWPARLTIVFREVWIALQVEYRRLHYLQGPSQVGSPVLQNDGKLPLTIIFR